MKIINLHEHKGVLPDGCVYVGRPSPFGNPFRIGRDGTRAQVIRKHEAWFRGNERLKKQVAEELKGKDLGCWCAPQRCHAEILLRCAAGELI